MKNALSFAGIIFLLSLGAARAADPPEMKEGLWSNHMQNTDQPGNRKTEGTTTVCRSHAYDQYVKDLAAKLQGCKKTSQNFDGRTFTSAMQCSVGNSVIDTRETAIYHADTIHSETHATYTPAMNGMVSTTMIVDQKYLGSCPAGSQPGDMKNENGQLINTWKH